MPTLPRNFENDICYHVYNCGVEKRTIFLNERDYERFLNMLTYYLHLPTISYSQFLSLGTETKKSHLDTIGKKKRVRIMCYALMPNHFHLLLKQETAGGISQFTADISNSYTRFFNLKRSRIGSLLQGTFKSTTIEDGESFLQVSRYIHLNPYVSSRVNWKPKLENYPYSSYRNWIKGESDALVDLSAVKQFIDYDKSDYARFVEAKKSTNPSLGIEKLILEKTLD